MLRDYSRRAWPLIPWAGPHRGLSCDWPPYSRRWIMGGTWSSQPGSYGTSECYSTFIVTHTHTHTHTHTYTHTHTHTHNTTTQKHTHTHIHTHTHTHTHKHKLTHAHTDVCTHKGTHTDLEHTHTHTILSGRHNLQSLARFPAHSSSSTVSLSETLYVCK